MFHKNHLEHKACVAGLAASITAGIWYVLGYLCFLLAQNVEIADRILQYIPQVFIMLQFAPCAIMGMGMGGIDIGCFVIGFFQIIIAAFFFAWLGARIYIRLKR